MDEGASTTLSEEDTAQTELIKRGNVGDTTSHNHLAPGMRIECRDAEWVVQSVDHTSGGGQYVQCEGLSELVRGRQQVFLSQLESGIRVLDPAQTQLIEDTSSHCRRGLLYLDTQLRRTPPTSDAISCAQNAALDILPFQFVPALTALNQPRPRILIADAVGLGKTLEAGILVSELIARGRGKRILVLATKSMLAQFQREFWNRFTIPLTRLDSAGIARLRSHIPANHNPFHYFDRAIVSIDTLKQDLEYRHHIENAYWDIIIIDEAHNVAHRAGHSQRSRLAELLATRSDALIMLSATPHDGKPESFASLVDMLDPTAIADRSNYASEDYRDKGLVVRRLKKDVMHQLQKSFPERHIDVLRSPATPQEEGAFDALMNVTFHTLDSSRGTGARLFRTVLEKALFSSSAACRGVIANRSKRLQKLEPTAERQSDLATLEDLDAALARIGVQEFSKYQRLVQLLRDDREYNWNPKAADDRLVIFTESIATLEFLAEHLPKDLKLKKKQVATLKGQGMRDREIMDTVEAFGQRDSDLRLLLCTDMASEGINLHHQSHRMIHFDIPWSLMVFQQRNGRIDRYGQSQQPLIRYLVTDSRNEAVRGDTRILEVLIEKDEQASKNLGDPTEFFGDRDTIAEQEAVVEEAVENDNFSWDDIFGTSAEDAESGLEAFAEASAAGDDALENILTPSRIYPDCYSYAKNAVAQLAEDGLNLGAEFDDAKCRLRIGTPKDLALRLQHLPREIRPDKDQWTLIESKQAMEDELKRCREEDAPWPNVHYLWDLHPVTQWLADRVATAMPRHSAPLLRATDRLKPGQHVFFVRGGFPNRRGYSVVDNWYAVRFEADQLSGLGPIGPAIKQLKLGEQPIPNKAEGRDVARLQSLLPLAINCVRDQLKADRIEVERDLNEKLNEQNIRLEELRGKHQQQLELKLSNSAIESVRASKMKTESARIEAIFESFWQWMEDTQTLEAEPWLQLGAVITGDEA